MTGTPRTAIELIEVVRNRLAMFLVGSFVLQIPMFALRAIPSDNRELIVYMVGQLSGMAIMALGYYFTNKVGQDALDAKRSDNTGKLADAVTKALDATPGAPVDDTGIIREGDAVEITKAEGET